MFDANTYDLNQQGVARPFHNQHQFGGTIGGPFLKHNAFFFFSYEGWREVLPAGVVTTVPTADMLPDASGNVNLTNYLAAVNKTAIYDPTTTTCVTPSTGGGCKTYGRTAFANNTIPAARISDWPEYPEAVSCSEPAWVPEQLCLQWKRQVPVQHAHCARGLQLYRPDAAVWHLRMVGGSRVPEPERIYGPGGPRQYRQLPLEPDAGAGFNAYVFKQVCSGCAGFVQPLLHAFSGWRAFSRGGEVVGERPGVEYAAVADDEQQLCARDLD